MSQTATGRSRLPLAAVIGAAVLFSWWSQAACTRAPVEAFPKVECRSPNEMRPTRMIYEWKFDQVREAIMAEVPETGEVMEFPALVEKVTDRFTEEERRAIGDNFAWFVETVTLELETRGELERVPETETPLPRNVRRPE